MKLMSKIHGEIQYDEKEVITFKKGIPGFCNLKKFIIVDLKELEPFKLLHSIENNEVAIVVTSPYSFYKNYDISIGDECINLLDIKCPSDVLVMVTVTLNSDIKKMTMNLQGPIVINTSNNLGEQIILNDAKYLVKTPLIEEV